MLTDWCSRCRWKFIVHYCIEHAFHAKRIPLAFGHTGLRRSACYLTGNFGAKYLVFFSSRSLKTREKCISFAQFVYFLREVCLLFNFWMIKFTIMFFFDIHHAWNFSTKVLYMSKKTHFPQKIYKLSKTKSCDSGFRIYFLTHNLWALGPTLNFLHT